MDSIIARLRNEPALVWGLIGTIAALIVSLSTGGGLTVAALPIIVAALARQFVTPTANATPTVDVLAAEDDAFDEGYASGLRYAAREEASRTATND